MEDVDMEDDGMERRTLEKESSAQVLIKSLSSPLPSLLIMKRRSLV